jgi:RecB family exonuclease
VITPRRIRLFRVPDLAAFRATFAKWALDVPASAIADACVVVPTRAAGEQVRRTVETEVSACLWPIIATRRELYEELAFRLPSPPAVLSAFEREVLLAAAARAVMDEGLVPPYELRPALVAEMLALYDQIRRLGRNIDDFDRNFRAELAPEQDTDRGAARLLQQTVFLAAAYRAYEARTAAVDRCDEHGLREVLVRDASPRPVRRVLMTVADRLADPDGLWPADFDLLTRVAGLECLDLLCTEATLAAGFIERVYAAFPDIEEQRYAGPRRASPVLITPAPSRTGEEAPLTFHYRDREEELAAVAKRVKQQQPDGLPRALHRTAIVVRRPLPYLYLARDVFADAGVPFETLDTLPLAAEPYAAAVDLALDAVTSGFTRPSLLALLRSPHFDFGETSREPAALVACDFALAEARYLGGLERLRILIRQWETSGAAGTREERRRQAALPALVPMLDAAEALQPLAESRRLVQHIETLSAWLRRFDRSPGENEPTRSRRLRVRAAVVGALAGLREAYERHDPSATGDAVLLSAAVRRWLGAQTFAAQTGMPGIQIIDAQAARYADLDDVQIVGVIEGEWPDRARRNVLYPASLLMLLEPLPAIADPYQRERDALQAARASFRDLVHAAGARVRLSTFALENDAVVEPSLLLDDVAAFDLAREQECARPSRVSSFDALALEPRRADVLRPVTRDWGAMRLARTPDDESRGQAGAWRLPRVSVSRLELYLNCPFKFFAAQVLKLEEQPEDEATQTPLERGRFLHELWEAFFAEWQRRGHGRIDPAHINEARALFAELADTALGTLSPSEAALERQKLLGSAVDPGIAYRVFAMEAGRPVPIAERLLEFTLEGDFQFRSAAGHVRTVALNAKTDRIDVLTDGTLRVIDYKSKNTPDPKVALQLPIYAHLAREVLARTRGRRWTLGEALYLSFEGDKAVVAMRPARGQTLDDVIADAQDRLIRALDSIAAGDFPARPAKKSLCGPCSYRAVCRLEIVEGNDEAETSSSAETVNGGE